MTEQQLLEQLHQRTAANPAYTQPIRVPRQKSNLSPFHQRCRRLAWLVHAITLGIVIQFALAHYLPTTSQESAHEQRL